MTIIPIAAKVYKAQLHNSIWPGIENILKKNQHGFRKKRFSSSQIRTIRWIIEGTWAKNLEATLMFLDFSKAFDSIHEVNMVHITSIWSPHINCYDKKMLYKKSKTMFSSSDGDTDAGHLQGDILVPHLFINCRDYVLRTSVDLMKENCFTLKQTRTEADDILQTL